MKKIYLIFTMLLCIAANGQYFQQTYGSAGDEQNTSGINTVVQGLGHFMAASTVGGAFTTPSISSSFADVNGTVPGAPYFDNEYVVVSNAGVVLTCRDPHVFELDNGNGFGIVGQYQDPSLPLPNSGVFYLQLDPLGNVLNAYDYTIVPAGANFWDVIHVAAIAEAAGGNELYITGWSQPNFPQVNTYVLKIDVNTGALLWGLTYDIVNPIFFSKDLSHDLVESPYLPEVVVVGQTYISGGPNSEAFLMRLDANTGLPFPVAYMYGTPASIDNFNAISVANNNQTGGPGFIIAGTSDANGSADFWLNLVDPVGNPFWATLHDYSINPGAVEDCKDVIERLNTSGNYEYYMVGTVYNGAIGLSDALVIKTDAAGNGVANGEFTYGSINYDYGESADQYNNTGSDGLSVFGTYNQAFLGSSDMYLVKAYFDGNSGCNEVFSNPNPSAGPSLFTKYPVKVYTKLQGNSFLWSQTTASNSNLCFNATIPGASNARIAPAEPKGEKEAIVSPNPMQQGTSVATVAVEADAAATVQVAIYDMLGRSYYSSSFTLAKGTNQLPLDISKTNMAAGMYTIKITGDDIAKNILLMVK